MGVTAPLRRLVRGAPARCFAAVGPGGQEEARWLRLAPEITVSDGPRAADVLLCVAVEGAALIEAVAATHDAMPRPRGVVAWWPLGGRPPGWPFPDAVVVREATELPAAAVRVRNELLDGVRLSSPDVLPDVDPAPWRGVGPFGQGGSGMTGGVPYGRPLAERAEDRDGLKLDQLLVRVGPFLPPWPPGLLLDVRIQGDVIQSVSLPETTSSEARGTLSTSAAGDEDVFVAALTRPMPLAELELARARSHLAALAEALRTSGLVALARRVLQLAADVRPSDRDRLARLERRLRRDGTLSWATGGVGRVSNDRARLLPAGPVARASGDHRDARSSDPSYVDLGFSPILDRGGDSAARWRVRLAEARQSLALAGRAGKTLTTLTGSVEGPQGTLDATGSPISSLVALLLELLPGQEWGDAVTTMVSLDIPAVPPGEAQALPEERDR